MARLLGLYRYISKIQDDGHMPNQPCLKFLWTKDHKLKRSFSALVVKLLFNTKITFKDKNPHFCFQAKNKKYRIIAGWKLKDTMREIPPFEYWYVHLVVYYCCSHILHFLLLFLCCWIDEGTISELMVDQIAVGEIIDKGALSERPLTRGHFWRDDWQWGHFWRDD